MTAEQLKQNPITVHPNQKPDTDEGESTRDEEEFTTPQELSEEHSTSDIQKSQNLQKHIKFLLYSTKQYIINNTS